MGSLNDKSTKVKEEKETLPPPPPPSPETADEQIPSKRSLVYRQKGLIDQLQRLLCRVEEGFVRSAYATFWTAEQSKHVDEMMAGIWTDLCTQFMEKNNLSFIPDYETDKEGVATAVTLPQDTMANLLNFIRVQAFTTYPMLMEKEKTIIGIGDILGSTVLYMGGDTPNYIRTFNLAAYLCQRFFAARHEIVQLQVKWKKDSKKKSLSDNEITLLQEQFKNYETHCQKQEKINKLRLITTSYVVECERHLPWVNLDSKENSNEQVSNVEEACSSSS